MMPENVDTLITGSVIVTMDEERRIIRDGALAIRRDRIAAVGNRADVEDKVVAASVIDGSRFVITPGFIDAHIHITGDPLTRCYVPDDIDDEFGDTLRRWVIPRYLAHTPDDERLSARLAAVEMLRAGTTCFLEAGTVRYLDEVVEGLDQAGIRARVGAWVEGRAFSPTTRRSGLDRQGGSRAGTGSGALPRAFRRKNSGVAHPHRPLDQFRRGVESGKGNRRCQ